MTVQIGAWAEETGLPDKISMVGFVLGLRSQPEPRDILLGLCWAWSASAHIYTVFFVFCLAVNNMEFWQRVMALFFNYVACV